MTEKRVYEVLYVEDLLKRNEQLMARTQEQAEEIEVQADEIEVQVNRIEQLEDVLREITRLTVVNHRIFQTLKDERFAEEMLKGYENERTN